MTDIRINKYLAEHGVCSRRGADALIDSGRVTVNGKSAVMGQTVSDTDIVLVDGKEIAKKAKRVVLAFNKPVGVVVSAKDDHAETLITDVVDYPERLTYAGRLDKDSEGLILLTNDGDFINASMRAINGHEKEYEVTLNRDIDEEDITWLSKGIYIKDLERNTKPCLIKKTSRRSVNMILTEGLNRQIRRMWKEAGYKVIKLKRIRVINVTLGNLKSGEWRELSQDELVSLYKTVGLEIEG